MARTALPLVALLALGSFAALSEAVDCGPGQTSFGNRCYRLYKSAASCDRDFSFADAQGFCRANGGELASIHSQAQNDFIKGLIKHATRKCDANKDFLYWIGLQLTHGADQFVNGALWTDGSAVNYGNPLMPSFQPPFVEGRPEHAHGNGNDDDDGWVVCPTGNEKACVQIFGYGKQQGLWTDAKCTKQHLQQSQCSKPQGGNAAVPHHPRKHHRDVSSSSSSEEDGEDAGVDQCRADAATNGFICEFCPAGWVYFNGACYVAVPGQRTIAAFDQACSALNASRASIHSDAENEFVAALANVASPNGNNLLGLVLQHVPSTDLSAPTAAAWTDGTAVDYANPIGHALWGVYPWAAGVGTTPAQPDNRPAVANAVLQWLNSGAYARWDDIAPDYIDNGNIAASVTVCKARF